MIKSGLVDRGKFNVVLYLIVISCSIGICFLGIRLNARQQHQRKIEHAEATIKNEAAKINQLNEQVRQLYQGDQEEFLTDPLEESSIKEVEGHIVALKSKAEDFGLKSKDFSVNTSDVVQRKAELASKIQEIKNKSTIQNQVTDLLVQDSADFGVVNAATVVINKEATADKILRIQEEIFGNTSTWHNVITAILAEMSAQVKQYNELKQSIDLMIDGEELTNNANTENLIRNFNQLELIKNDTLRKGLTDKLELIDRLIQNHSVSAVPNVSEEEVPLLPSQ